MKKSKLTHKEENRATLAAVILFGLLILLMSFSKAAEPIKGDSTRVAAKTEQTTSEAGRLLKSIQCNATAKKTGLQCKNRTKAISGFCRAHLNQKGAVK